jgi:hypothetical protein
MGEGQLTNYYPGWDRLIYDETANFTEEQFWYLLDWHHKRKEKAARTFTGPDRCQWLG